MKGADSFTEQALYLYGFQFAAQEPLTDLVGLDEGQRVSGYCHAGLTAYVSWVWRRDFEAHGDQLQAEDLQWLTWKTQRHQAVVEALMRQGAVFPVAFGTLFSSEQALCETMQAQQEQIVLALRRVSGCREWAVQVRLDHDAMVDARLAARAGLPDALSDSPGLRHLQTQRLRREVKRTTGQWVAAWSSETLAVLRPLAKAFHDRQRLLAENQIINWAFLVAQPEEEAFLARLARIQREGETYGMEVHGKGPWPPYSFCNRASE